MRKKIENIMRLMTHSFYLTHLHQFFIILYFLVTHSYKLTHSYSLTHSFLLILTYHFKVLKFFLFSPNKQTQQVRVISLKSKNHKK